MSEITIRWTEGNENFTETRLDMVAATALARAMAGHSRYGVFVDGPKGSFVLLTSSGPLQPRLQGIR